MGRKGTVSHGRAGCPGLRPLGLGELWYRVLTHQYVAQKNGGLNTPPFSFCLTLFGLLAASYQVALGMDHGS